MATFGDSTANVGRLSADSSVPINAVRVFGSDSVGIGESAIWSTHIAYPMAQLIGNFGIDGQDTSQMLATNRQAPFSGQPMSIQDLINVAPDLVILRGGSINDLGNATPSNRDGLVANCVSNHRTMLQRMVVDGGLKVLDCGIFGYDEALWGNYAGTGSAIRQALLQVNTALAAMANESQFGGNVRFVSPLGTLHDTSGRYLAGMTNDGVHLSLAGGLAQGRLEANAIAAWLGAGTGTAYPGTNLMANASLQRSGGPGTQPDGYFAYGFNTTPDTPLIETIDGKTYFTARATLPAGGSNVIFQLPFVTAATGGLGANEVIGCEFDIYYERQTGPVPRLTELDVRQQYVWGGNVATHFAAFSARATSATTSSLRGRAVFLPFRLPVGSGSFDSNQTLVRLNLGFGADTGGTVVKVGIGNPRLVRA